MKFLLKISVFNSVCYHIYKLHLLNIYMTTEKDLFHLEIFIFARKLPNFYPFALENPKMFEG